MLIDLKFYAALFLRRLHYFLAIAISMAAVGITIAYTLPPVYEAEAKLLVESPQIPGDLAASTVRTDAPEILQIIRQRLLTRANLLEISRKFGVHADSPDMSPDDIVADMLTRTKMSLPRTRDVAYFVSISFKAPTARMSAEVTNELVTRVLQENVAIRTQATGQTLDFFEQEVERLDRELADQGQRILEFKLRHKNALPDSLDFRRDRQASLQERLLQVERELVSLKDRLTRLQELQDQAGALAGASGRELTPDERRLKQLQDELTAALTLYSEQNPKVRALRAQLEAQERKVLQQVTGNPDNPEEMTVFDLQKADIEAQMDFLSDQKAGMEAELETLSKSIDETPSNAVALGTLERDYENLRVQYNQATAALAAARTGDQIEAQSRGQRISVIEQAVPPEEPTSPNRRKIAAAGILGGILAGAGLIAGFEFLKGSIRRPQDLSNRLGMTPFVTIPYIRTRRQIATRRIAIIAILLIVGLGIPAALYQLHLHYMPMDMMVEKALDKTGIAAFLSRLGVNIG